MANTNLAIPTHSVAKAPLFIAINNGSGADAPDLPNVITEKLKDLGHSVTLFEIPNGATVAESCKDLVTQAAAENGIVVAAGGDGTVNALATLCYQSGATLAVVPLGTFNYFARALGIPTELDAALEVVSTGKVRKVSAGFVQEHLFLNNASFGLYPTLIRKREQASSRYGRKRFVAALSALHSLFYEQKLFAVKLHKDNASETHRTSMVFVGNNSFQLDNLGLEVSECAENDRLAAVILKPLNRWQTCRLMWRGIVKNLKFESKLVQFCADTFEVETKRQQIDMVIDGEIVRCTTPLQFRVEGHAINVLVPAATEKA